MPTGNFAKKGQGIRLLVELLLELIVRLT
ncbi:Protein of unknown function [Bacillus toyonensis]|nr:Protein of unknown function [Bacillus toyonensis]